MTEFKGLGEVVVDAVIGKLQNGWADRAGAINTAYNDMVQITAPGVGDYFEGRMSQVAVTPAVFVIAGPAKFNEQGAHSMTVEYEINVHIVEEAQTGPLLARRLLRQARAVIECLYDDPPQEAAYIRGQTTVIGPYRIFPKRVVPGVVFQPSGDDTWRGTYLIVFTCQQEEI